MSQTSYSKNQPEAFAGLFGDLGVKRIESFSVEGVAGIRFGLAVAVGTDPVEQVQVPVAGDAIRGIAGHRHVAKALSSGEAKYQETDTADVMKQGLIWMPVSGATPAIDAPVYAMVDTPADAGFATAAAGTDNILIPTAVCRKVSTDPDGATIILVEINTP